MKQLLFAILIFTFVSSVFGQQLYMPRNVARAFANGTRSADGSRAQSIGRTKAFTTSRSTSLRRAGRSPAAEDITYTNNSPNALDRFVFRLELNNHQPEAPREYPTIPEYLTSGRPYRRIFRERQGQTVSERDGPHVCAGQARSKARSWSVREAQLSNGMSISPSTATVPTAAKASIDPTTFFIAYFYPRVAVYDDTDGWDMAFFTGGHEFYNDFNDYTLSGDRAEEFRRLGHGRSAQRGRGAAAADRRPIEEVIHERRRHPRRNAAGA